MSKLLYARADSNNLKKVVFAKHMTRHFNASDQVYSTPKIERIQSLCEWPYSLLYANLVTYFSPFPPVPQSSLVDVQIY